MHIVLVVSFYALLLVRASCGLQLSEPSRNVFGRCILPLGMEEGKIPDDAITASSSYEMKSVGPQNARIRQEKNGGAWCPKAQISSAIREYLEVDLTRNHLIAWTETQGRFGNGQGQEYAEAFFLEYFRDSKWHQYKTLKGDRVLRGNSNTYLVEKQKLELPFVASRVRFVPYSQHPRTVCMRVEIYGCLWEQHLTSYSGPKGSAIGPEGRNVEDSSYDGVELDSRTTKMAPILIQGLGQLTDGILGEDSEILSSSTSSRTNWVGWTDRETLELIFEFEDLREFDNCSIHVADLSEHRIELFSSLRVWFSLDGRKYHPDPETLDIPMQNRSGTGVRSIGLQSRIGKFLKLEFTLAGEWLLLSEITFQTASGSRNLSGDESSEDSLGVSPIEGEVNADLDQDTMGSNQTIYDEPSKEDTTPDAFPVGSSQTYIGLVSGLLTMVVLLLTCTTFLMKQRGRNKVALLQKHTALLCSSSAPGIINPKDVKLPNPVVVNGLSQSRLSLKSKNTLSDPENNSRPTEVIAGTANTNDERIYQRSTLYHSTYTLFSEEKHNGDGSLSNCEAEYSDLKAQANLTNERKDTATPTPPYQSKRPSHFQSVKPRQKVHEGYYAATDILTIKKREQSTALSLFTPLRICEKNICPPRSLEAYEIQRVSRHRLRTLDKLGEGGFGLVHLCEAKGLENPQLGTVQNRQIVIVRSLWRGVVDSLRKDFTKDMYALSTIRDPNIVRMIALLEEEPLGAVFEYGHLGDLPSFLQKHENTAGKEVAISYAYRLNFSAQIASGMKYLESHHIAHCDLAARNCIVFQNLTVKVSDHAMYCTKYDRQYYVDGYYAKVPLRWMSWEAALLATRHSRGDVWSYAITVWELLTSCEDLPYADLTSEQVLENLSRWYHTDPTNQQPRILPKPSCCPDDLYRLMTKCWSKEPEDRPTFEDIYLYLERLGFD